MPNYTYSTHGVCSRKIEFEVEGDIVKNVKFVNGCSGNLQGIGKLVEGMNIEEVIAKLEGIDCNGRGTSCPDQLAKGLKEMRK